MILISKVCEQENQATLQFALLQFTFILRPLVVILIITILFCLYSRCA